MDSIGVIGVGRLGICTALVLEKAGFHVFCYDVNPKMRVAIQTRTLESPEKGVSEMLAVAKRITAVEKLEDLLHLRTLFCIVPTPSLPDHSYNHQYIEEMADEMIRVLKQRPCSPILLNICCTTMPGYCDTLQAKFQQHSLPVHVCYNPEFIAQGDILNGFVNPDLLLIGEANESCGDRLVSIYSRFVKSNPHICRMTRKEAELTKIAINCFITTKISFANTIGDLCVDVGANPDRVLRAIGSDSRIGKKYLGWGHGYGGPCFPRDNRALCAFAQTTGVHNGIGEATDAGNAGHLQFLKTKLIELQKKTGKPFLFRNLAYKPGTVILEESQSLALARLLDLEGYPIYVQESPDLQAILQQQYPYTFLFVNEPIDPESYVLVDKDLSCFRIRM